MPESRHYKTKRFFGSERHEVFEGRKGNRTKSIEDGLVIFLTPGQHRTDRDSVHLNPANPKWKEVQKIAEKRWCEYYHKDPKDFMERYGKNYL